MVNHHIGLGSFIERSIVTTLPPILPFGCLLSRPCMTASLLLLDDLKFHFLKAQQHMKAMVDLKRRGVNFQLGMWYSRSYKRIDNNLWLVAFVRSSLLDILGPMKS